MKTKIKINDKSYRVDNIEYMVMLGIEDSYDYAIAYKFTREHISPKDIKKGIENPEGFNVKTLDNATGSAIMEKLKKINNFFVNKDLAINLSLIKSFEPDPKHNLFYIINFKSDNYLRFVENEEKNLIESQYNKFKGYNIQSF